MTTTFAGTAMTDADHPDAEELQEMLAFLARIPAEPDVREQLNWMQTALDVSELAAGLGHRFRPETLIDAFRRSNETPYARVGLMDEKLIRLHLRREALLAETP
jgi:hypothetical protein